MRRGCQLAMFFVIVVGMLGFFAVMCGQNLSDAYTAEHYWVRGCVTGDGALLLVGGDEAAAIDLEKGTVAARDELWGQAVACGTSGGIAYGSSETMVRLPSREKAPTDTESTVDVVASRSDGTLVHLSRSSDSRGGYRGAAQLRTTKAGKQGLALALEPALFGEVGAGKKAGASAFFTRAGPVLGDGRLLLAVGWLPDRSGSRVEPAPWGFFGLELDTGAVSQLGATQRSTAALDGSMLWAASASADGALLVAAFRGESSIEVAVYGEGAPAVATIDGAREPQGLSVSARGDRVAVGALAPDGSSSKVVVLSADAKVLWTSAVLEGSVPFSAFLDDGSVVLFTTKRAFMRIGPDFATQWQGAAPP